MRPLNPKNAGGFTLLELIIALTLIALIVTLLFAGIRLANRSWEAADTKSQIYSEKRLIWRFLHDRLGQTRNIIRTLDGERIPVFYGDRQAFEFVSPMPAHLGVSGLYMLRIHRSGKNLKLTRWLYHDDILEGPDGIPEWRPLSESGSDPGSGPDDMRAYYSQSELVTGLKSVDIEYYGNEEGREDLDWSDQWEEPHLPRLVRIQLADEKGEWPELILGVGY